MHILISVIDMTLSLWFGIWTMGESFEAIGEATKKDDPDYEPPKPGKAIEGMIIQQSY